METNFNEVLYSSDELFAQFNADKLIDEKTINIGSFLDVDRTINLEKLELAISLLISYLEKSVKSENPIYVYLGDMDTYFNARNININNIERITEEAQFIIGFCQAIADEESVENKFVFQFKGK